MELLDKRSLAPSKSQRSCLLTEVSNVRAPNRARPAGPGQLQRPELAKSTNQNYRSIEAPPTKRWLGQQRPGGSLVGCSVQLLLVSGLLAFLAACKLPSAVLSIEAAPLGPAVVSDEGRPALQSANEAWPTLEAELNSLLQQHEAQNAGTGVGGSKPLTEAIISRLMLGNTSNAGLAEPSGELDNGTEPQVWAGSPADEPAAASAAPPAAGSPGHQELSGFELARLKKLLDHLYNYELAQSSGLNNGQVFNQFPVLPASQAATIKRASLKVGNFLRQQQYQRQLNSHGRNTFDFGLGKRPDAGVASNILRLGDTGAHLQTVSGQIGKRPGAHRYDFGLGKRLASPAYPRYDFGLGKRAPTRIRYDFGLGK